MSIDAAVEAIKSRYQVERWGMFPVHPNAHNGKSGGRTRKQKPVDPRKAELAMARAARNAAFAAGLKHFQGAPCVKCGSVLRYTIGIACVDCHLRGKRASKNGGVR